MEISKVLLSYVPDGDAHLVLLGVKHSTNLREIVTVGYMIENPIIDEEEGGERYARTSKNLVHDRARAIRLYREASNQTFRRAHGSKVIKV